MKIFFVILLQLSYVTALAALPNIPIHTEKELLILASQGSETAFTELYHLHKDKLYGFLLGITKSEELTLDLIQDIYMGLWINRANLPEIENLGGYIFKSANNKAINALKRLMNESNILKKLPDSNFSNSNNNIETNLEYKSLEQNLNGIIKSLPSQQRLVYTLSREYGLKYEEIADQLHISPLTVKNHIVQALKTIRKSITNVDKITTIIFYHFYKAVGFVFMLT